MKDHKVKIKKLQNFTSDLELPSYKTKEAAGADVRACLGPGEKMVLKPGSRVLIPTGLSFEIPSGFEIQIRPRSGLSINTSLMILNSPGTIDSDYRGELQIIMGNLGSDDQIITHGDRVAQMVLAPVVQATFEVVDELNETVRGAGGFGSTGHN